MFYLVSFLRLFSFPSVVSMGMSRVWVVCVTLPTAAQSVSVLLNFWGFLVLILWCRTGAEDVWHLTGGASYRKGSHRWFLHPLEVKQLNQKAQTIVCMQAWGTFTISSPLGCDVSWEPSQSWKVVWAMKEKRDFCGWPQEGHYWVEGLNHLFSEELVCAKTSEKTGSVPYPGHSTPCI